MIKFLLIVILFFFLLVFLLGFSFLRFLAQMFGLKPPTQTSKRGASQQRQQNRSQHTQQPPQNSSRKKVFDKNQGEYTDYEEVE